MMTVPEVVRRAGRNPETIRRWIRAGRLRSRKVGTQHLVDEAEVRAMLGRDALPRPTGMKRTATGEPMPDVLAVLRRQRAGH